MEYLKVTVFLAYLPIKLIAYIVWCYVGFSYLKLHFTDPKLRATVYGLIRLLIGLLLAMVFVVLAMSVFDINRPVLTGLIVYLIIYLPFRWFEWSLLEFIMNPKCRTFDYFIFGVNKLSRRWRLGGVILCAVLDLPFIIVTKGASLGNIYMC